MFALNSVLSLILLVIPVILFRLSWYIFFYIFIFILSIWFCLRCLPCKEWHWSEFLFFFKPNLIIYGILKGRKRWVNLFAWWWRVDLYFPCHLLRFLFPSFFPTLCQMIVSFLFASLEALDCIFMLLVVTLIFNTTISCNTFLTDLKYSLNCWLHTWLFILHCSAFCPCSAVCDAVGMAGKGPGKRPWKRQHVKDR